jgi:hypothetical protein
MAKGDKPDGPAEVLALRNELGRLNSLGLLQALIFSLRIADGLGQHLAQLSLGLRGFPLGWLPLCHQDYVGMQRWELNPVYGDNPGPLLPCRTFVISPGRSNIALDQYALPPSAISLCVHFTERRSLAPLRYYARDQLLSLFGLGLA